MMLRPAILLASVAAVASHGSLVHPRSRCDRSYVARLMCPRILGELGLNPAWCARNSIDYLVNVNTEHCANVTGDKCNNGQAAFYYSQVRLGHAPLQHELPW